MMFILAVEGGVSREEVIWHVGEPFPDLGNPRVVKIHADEDELAYLLDRLKTEASK